MESPKQEQELVSLRELKELAVRHLNASSPLRKLILSQPDELPRSVALSKIPDFALLLEYEVRG
jgi:hypothetical protein